MSSSDDFFKDFNTGHSGSNVPQQRRSGTAGAKKKPPPPPPRRPQQQQQKAFGYSASSATGPYSVSQQPTMRSASNPAQSSSSATATSRRQPRRVVQTTTPAPAPTAPAASNPFARSSIAPPQQQQQQPGTFRPASQPQYHGGASGGASSYYGQPQQQAPPASAPQPQQQQQLQQTQGNSYGGQPSSYGQPQLQQHQQSQSQYSQFQPQAQPNQFNSDLPAGLEGTMDGGAPSVAAPAVRASAPAATPNVFVPNMNTGNGNNNKSSGYNDEDFANEPPLLDELGIHPEHIYMKVKAVVLPFSRVWGNSAMLDPSVIVEDADLAGPAVFGLALGGELLLTGKIHFGYIYGFFLSGCLAMTLLINLLSPKQSVSFWVVTSILGYSLIPVNVLAAVKILLVNMFHLSTLGQFLGAGVVCWSTYSSTRLLEKGCDLRDQRYLLAYPLAMVYTAFVLITIF